MRYNTFFFITVTFIGCYHEPTPEDAIIAQQKLDAITAVFTKFEAACVENEAALKEYRAVYTANNGETLPWDITAWLLYDNPEAVWPKKEAIAVVQARIDASREQLNDTVAERKSLQTWSEKRDKLGWYCGHKNGLIHHEEKR